LIFLFLLPFHYRFAARRSGGLPNEMPQKAAMIKFTKIFQITAMPPFCLAAVIGRPNLQNVPGFPNQ